MFLNKVKSLCMFLYVRNFNKNISASNVLNVWIDVHFESFQLCRDVVFILERHGYVIMILILKICYQVKVELKLYTLTVKLK